jgi:hypothetical protein
MRLTILDDRYLRLGVTFRAAGRRGRLDPGLAAALDAVLESLGKKAGPATPAPPDSAATTRWKRRAGGWWLLQAAGACG